MRTEPEYIASEVVLEDASSVVTRAERDGRRVLLRRSSKEHPTSHDLAKVRYGASVARGLDLPGVVKVLEVLEHPGQVVVVLEDFGGVPLRNLLARRRIEVNEALGIAREVAKILGALRRERVIHCNVEPANVYVDATSGAVKIANFDNASRRDRDNPGLVGASRLEGTLPYISPEQTGRMNRSVDYRTDLYSLGVTLYEMLAGRPPFDATEPTALVHCHVAVVPEPPHRIRPAVDEAVSSVVMKLLAKSAEDRYQTAQGLLADLEECLSQLASMGTIGDFVPGAHDVAIDFRVPEKLYGREAEKAQLLAALDRAAGGTAELVLLSGPPGIGKSALVGELRRSVAERRGLFAAGKLTDLHDAPHGGLSQAIQGLLRELASEGDRKVAGLRKRLGEALGASAQVVIDVIPEVARILGDQPAAPPLGAAEAQNRFDLVFQRFIHVFARREHPLTIFLDDLEWADAASLRLLRLLVAEPAAKYLLIIGTYRVDAGPVAHPVSPALSALRQALPSITEIALGPLEPGAVRRMLVDTLGCADDEAAHELARFVHERGGGNPFFVHQIVTSLHARELLGFDAGAGRWQWHLPHLQAAGVAEDVDALLTTRIAALPAATRRVLGIAACLGDTFDLEALASLGERSILEASADLSGAVEAGLVRPIGDDYKYLESSPTGDDARENTEDPRAIRHEFLHDRIREVARGLLPDEVKRALHLRAGRWLLARGVSEERDARIFEILNQIDRSLDLVGSPEERYRLARLHLVAAERAKRSTAYSVAIGYLEIAIGLLGKDGSEVEPDLTFSIHALRAECEHLLGHAESALERCEAAIDEAVTRADKVRIRALQAAVHSSRGDHEGATQASAAALALHGVIVPAPIALDGALEAELGKLDARLAGLRVLDLVHLAEATDPDVRALAALLAETMALGGGLDSKLLSFYAVTLVKESLAHGVAPGSSLGYATYALSHRTRTGDYAAAHALGEVGLGLAQRLDALDLRARVELLFGAFVNPWSRPMRTSYPYIERAYAALIEAGSPSGAGVAAAQSIFLPLLGGDELQALHERARRHYDLQKRLGYVDNARLMACFLRMLARLTDGVVPAELEAEPSPPSSTERSAPHFALGHAHELLDIIVAFIFGDHPRAFSLATGRASPVRFVCGHLAEVELRFFRALLVAPRLPISTGEERELDHAIFEEDKSKLASWAESCPQNFGYKYDLVRAEEARATGDNEVAMALYDRAIEGAAEQELTHHQAIATELAARFYLARGHRKIAAAYLADARHAYLRWGATAKVAALDAQHGALLSRAGFEGRSAARGQSGAPVDLVAAMRAAQAISAEIVLDELLRRLMDTVVNSAGAERGLLFLKGDHEILVEVAAGAAPSLVTDASVEDRGDVSRAVVRYVERTRERILLEDAANAGQFRSDPYVATARPRSILCLPIISAQRLIGVLYLEDNRVTSAFTEERCQVVELLAEQAAISLENARRYDALASRLKDRALELASSTEELSLSLRRLKDTQKQLLVQEKLASLGALTSGIAHEIKNPLNFINNFAELSVGVAAELRAEIEQQQARLDPDRVATIDELVGDLQQNALKINQHGRRADDIVRAMLEHSRAGGGERRAIDVNALLGQYTNLAYQGFRSHDASFNVTIETDYDPAVGVLLLPAQEIGRVFLNLINNACYAARAQRHRQGPRFSPTIRVATRSLGDRVEIRIRDNGAGIPAAVREKIFNPFFTTKPAGEGTGLGLSISHEIIEANGGTLAFESIEGIFTEFTIALPREAP